MIHGDQILGLVISCLRGWVWWFIRFSVKLFSALLLVDEFGKEIFKGEIVVTDTDKT